MPLYQSDRSPLSIRWAFTVRPDLWPPGWSVLGPRVQLARSSWSHTSALGELALAVKAGYGTPGAAEALILGGVRASAIDPSRHWEEVT